MTVRLSALILSCFMMISCTPIGMLTSIGTTAGTFAMEERGLQGVTDDLGLKADVIAKWANEDLSFTTDLTVIVYNAKALIIGSVDNQDQRAQAVAKTWEVAGIKDVFNEIILKKHSSLQDFAHDTWIDTSLLASVTFDAQIMDINYRFETEGGTVYLIGMAQSPAELNRFIAHAKSTSYVRKVISHVEIKPRKSMFRPSANKPSSTNDPA
ncbi:putative Periplasmic or secreted lipoprotein [Candidatus Terasakiella magnetica]|uniref:Putative Periplasmic or secreted lipoprotein n=1 Tax=Candidatus Terasakiella magnetica TaxID=1867952 RepID=A0A1C3RGL7_9PROT|nr:BON domain-containing protein [Candidatus Terasakiella magnetica]SCA56430.1 putative Periplasmic or secreted lipoprotein [Candidatus Terasakiella magnetica]